ncbi:hypothetical protein Tco_1083395 [Tanacetum coccineum]
MLYVDALIATELMCVSLDEVPPKSKNDIPPRDNFVSTTFSALPDVTPTTLDTSYAVELAYGRISETNILAKYHALIVCDEKVVRIPYGNEVLIIQGDSCDSGSMLNIISYTKTQKYIEKGCQVYLAQATSKKAEDKSEEKRLEDVPIVREFPEVFPEDLPGLLPARQVKFQIDPWCCTCSTSPVLISTSRNAGVIHSIARTF